MRNLVSILFVLMSLGFVSCSDSNDRTDSDKVVDEFKEAGKKMEHGVEKGARAVQEATCDMYDSDAECAAKKAKNDVEDTAEEFSE